MKESKIEKQLCKNVKKLRGLCLKLIAMGRNFVPDRLVLLPIPEEDRATVAKYVQFVECKTPDGVTSPGQNREIARLKRLGFMVYILRSKL